ncbi:hypothetical protein ACP02H_002632, partial [Staphylococcus pseudintermedius]
HRAGKFNKNIASIASKIFMSHPQTDTAINSNHYLIKEATVSSMHSFPQESRQIYNSIRQLF